MARMAKTALPVKLAVVVTQACKEFVVLLVHQARRASRVKRAKRDVTESGVLKAFKDHAVCLVRSAREVLEVVVRLVHKVHKESRDPKAIKVHQAQELVVLLDQWVAKARQVLLVSLVPKVTLEPLDHKASLENLEHRVTVGNPVKWAGKVFVVRKVT